MYWALVSSSGLKPSWCYCLACTFSTLSSVRVRGKRHYLETFTQLIVAALEDSPTMPMCMDGMAALVRNYHLFYSALRTQKTPICTVLSTFVVCSTVPYRLDYCAANIPLIDVCLHPDTTTSACSYSTLLLSDWSQACKFRVQDLRRRSCPDTLRAYIPLTFLREPITMSRTEHKGENSGERFDRWLFGAFSWIFCSAFLEVMAQSIVSSDLVGSATSCGCLDLFLLWCEQGEGATSMEIFLWFNRVIKIAIIHQLGPASPGIFCRWCNFGSMELPQPSLASSHKFVKIHIQQL